MVRSLAAALFLVSTAAVAEPETYRWADGACRGTVRYDPEKIDGQALRDTIDLLKSEAQTVPVSPAAATPEGFAKLDPLGFERSCQATAASIRERGLLPMPGLEAFRRERAAQVDDACALGSAAMRGYADPTALSGYARASGSCDLYVDALEGRTDLVSVWDRVVDARCAKDDSPTTCRSRFEEDTSGPQATNRMRATVVAYGWLGCATSYSSFTGEARESLRKASDALRKAFLRSYRARETCGPE